MKHLKKLLLLLVPILFFGITETSAQTKGEIPDYLTGTAVKSYDTDVDGFKWILRNLPEAVTSAAVANFSSMSSAQKSALVAFADSKSKITNGKASAAWHAQFKAWVQSNMSATVTSQMYSSHQIKKAL